MVCSRMDVSSTGSRCFARPIAPSVWDGLSRRRVGPDCGGFLIGFTSYLPETGCGSAAGSDARVILRRATSNITNPHRLVEGGNLIPNWNKFLAYESFVTSFRNRLHDRRIINLLGVVNFS